MSRDVIPFPGDLAWFRATTWSWSSLGEQVEPDGVVSAGALVTVLEVREVIDAALVLQRDGRSAWVPLHMLARAV